MSSSIQRGRAPAPRVAQNHSSTVTASSRTTVTAEEIARVTIDPPNAGSEIRCSTNHATNATIAPPTAAAIMPSAACFSDSWSSAKTSPTGSVANGSSRWSCGAFVAVAAVGLGGAVLSDMGPVSHMAPTPAPLLYDGPAPT